MTEPNKEELARLLGQMAAGDAAVEPEAGATPASDGPAETLAPLGSAPHAGRLNGSPAAGVPLLRSLFLKRTIIPILLTLGVICLGVGSLGFVVGPLSPYYVLRDPWISVPLFSMGFVLLFFAAVTMIQVRIAYRRA